MLRLSGYLDDMTRRVLDECVSALRWVDGEAEGQNDHVLFGAI